MRTHMRTQCEVALWCAHVRALRRLRCGGGGAVLDLPVTHATMIFFPGTLTAFVRHLKTRPEILPVLVLTSTAASYAAYSLSHTFGAPDILSDLRVRRVGASWNASNVDSYEHAVLDIRPGRRGWGANPVFDESV